MPLEDDLKSQISNRKQQLNEGTKVGPMEGATKSDAENRIAEEIAELEEIVKEKGESESKIVEVLEKVRLFFT